MDTIVGNSYKTGDEVILGKHQAGPNWSKNWNSDMEQYVGKKATIIGLSMVEPVTGYHLYLVDIDVGAWHWRGVNMTPVQVSAPAAVKHDGAFCTRCKNYVQYAEPSPTFRCWSCRH